MSFKKFTKKFLITSLLLVFLGTSFILPNSAKANVLAVQTNDTVSIGSTIAQTGKDVVNWAKDMAYKQWEWLRDE